MADRYHNRAYSADNRENHPASSMRDGDPLAELARLIGQADPQADFGCSRQAAPVHDDRQDEFTLPEPADEVVDDGGAPPWMQRRNIQKDHVEQVYENDVHPVRRYAAAYPSARRDHGSPSYARDEQPPAAETGRYDDALYGPVDADPAYDAHHAPSEETLHADPYGYQDGYGETEEYDEYDEHPRRKGMKTVIAVLALAVVGTGAAFAYRNYVGSPRIGEPPIIKADTGSNKVTPPSASENAAKAIQERLASGSDAEKLVSREEQPVDVKDIATSGPRVVFPALNQNTNPPTTASVSPDGRFQAKVSNGTIPGEEPRKIKTLAIHPNRADANSQPIATPATTPAARNPSPASAGVPAPVANANAAAGHAPLSLAPQSAPTNSRVASIDPAPAAGGGYVVQVSSQRSEAAAKASFKSLQAKYPSALGSRSPLIKKADLGSRGTYYRAMVGPFGTPEQASQFCGDLKAAGGQCVVQRN